MTTERNPLTPALVWLFLEAGCNANEIAAFGGISTATAAAWMHHARRTFATSQPQGLNR